MSDHNEAMRLAGELVEVHRGHADEGPSSFSEAAALLRKQAERIAELEARVHTCGPTCSKAGCINRRVTAERDTLRAEVERLHKICVEQAQALIERPAMVIDTARKATQ